MKEGRRHHIAAVGREDIAAELDNSLLHAESQSMDVPRKLNEIAGEIEDIDVSVEEAKAQSPEPGPDTARALTRVQEELDSALDVIDETIERENGPV